MTRRHHEIGLTLAALAATIALAPSCRLEPGPTDYASQPFFDDSESDMGGVTRFLPGPDPYVQGEPRIIFGPFYEGASSDALAVDDVSNFFFVFDVAGTPTILIDESDERIEGLVSNRFTHSGTTFWGMNISFLDGDPNAGGMPRPEDLSRWETLHISLRSSDPGFATVNVGVASPGGDILLPAADYGYTNDGEWHTLDIPLADFVAAGADLSAIIRPLVLSGTAADIGDTLLVDNFYWTADGG